MSKDESSLEKKVKCIGELMKIAEKAAIETIQTAKRLRKAAEAWPKDDKARDPLTGAQLDDLYPEDAPHQEDSQTWLKKARGKMTMVEFAQVLDIPYWTYVKYEYGTRVPSKYALHYMKEKVKTHNE